MENPFRKFPEIFRKSGTIFIYMKLLDILKETLDISDKYRGSKDIVKTFQNKGHYKWMDYLKPGVNVPKKDLDLGLRNTLEILVNQFNYKLKRVVIKDKGEIVSFLIFTDNGNESIDNIGDGNTYPVLIATAVEPEYRNRGLLKMMIDKSNIQKPYLVHTSVISPPGLWEKFGCKIVKELSDDNKIMKCD
jgi:hypothetical protein